MNGFCKKSLKNIPLKSKFAVLRLLLQHFVSSRLLTSEMVNSRRLHLQQLLLQHAHDLHLGFLHCKLVRAFDCQKQFPLTLRYGLVRREVSPSDRDTGVRIFADLRQGLLRRDPPSRLLREVVDYQLLLELLEGVSAHCRALRRRIVLRLIIQFRVELCGQVVGHGFSSDDGLSWFAGQERFRRLLQDGRRTALEVDL